LERVSGESGLALAVLADLRDQAVGVDAARAGLAEHGADRLLPWLAAVLFGFSGSEPGLALAGHGAVGLLYALRVRAARVGLASRDFD
jgi:hypothetical protein